MFDLLIGFLLGISLSLIAINSLVKQYFANKGKFRSMIARLYHKDQIPTAARIIGLTNLVLLGMMRLLNLLEILSKPGHQEYGKLGMQEAEDILSILHKLKSEADELHRKIIKIVKEYEHLQ